MSTKVRKIDLKNFANYVDVSLSIDPNITFLVGKNGSGKSTAGATGVQAIFMGIAEKATDGKQPVIGERFRFIGKNGATAKGEITLYDDVRKAEVIISRKFTKTGTELMITPGEGWPADVKLDQQYLNDIFNMFLISPKAFYELKGTDQARALGIDTEKLDAEMKALKTQYTEINAVYRSFGELVEPEKAEKVDTDVLLHKKAELKKAWDAQYEQNKADNKKLRDDWEANKKTIDSEVETDKRAQAKIVIAVKDCVDAAAILGSNGYDGDEVGEFIAALRAQVKPPMDVVYPAEPTYIPEMPSMVELDAIDTQIVNAAAINGKVAAYEAYVQKKADKDARKAQLDKNEEAQKAKAKERIEYIQKFKFPFKDLAINEYGELTLAGKLISDKYFSTGELMKIVPMMIASQNPELKYVFLQDFSLLDEDMQKSIPEYLVAQGFQLVLELVGKEKVEGVNCILLKDNEVVDSYESNETGQQSLL